MENWGSIRTCSTKFLYELGAPPVLKKLSMFNNLSGERKGGVVGLTTENNTEANKKEERREDAQKESTLQPITKVNSKLDKELQEWEVESTKGGANDGGG